MMHHISDKRNPIEEEAENRARESYYRAGYLKAVEDILGKEKAQEWKKENEDFKDRLFEKMGADGDGIGEW